MTTFLFYLSLSLVAYFVIGYVVSFVFILRDKAGGKIVREFLTFDPEGDVDRYSWTILLWPLLLFILTCMAVGRAGKVIVKAFSRINLTPVQPETLVNKIADRNKMTTLIEGEDAEDG